MTSIVAQADVMIDSPAAGGPRGVLAKRSFSPDEVILSIPGSMAIPFEGSPEEATVLLLHIKHDRRRRAQYQPWLNALPGPQDFIAWDSVDDQSLSMLQCSEMVSRPLLIVHVQTILNELIDSYVAHSKYDFWCDGFV